MSLIPIGFCFRENFFLKVLVYKLITLRWAIGLCFCPQHMNSCLILPISPPSVFMKIPFKMSIHRWFFSSLSWSWDTERLHFPQPLCFSTVEICKYSEIVASDSNQALPVAGSYLLLASLHLGSVALMGTQASLFNQRWYRPENCSLVPGKHRWLKNSSVNKQPSYLRSIFTVLGWSEETCSISLILCDTGNFIYHQPVYKIITTMMVLCKKEIRNSSAWYGDIRTQLAELWKSAMASKPHQKTFVYLIRDSEWSFILCFIPSFQDFIDYLFFQDEESIVIWILQEKIMSNCFNWLRNKEETTAAIYLTEPFETASHKTCISKSRKLSETATGWIQSCF